MRNDGRVLLSVIIPVYNVEAYLDRCIESVVGQTYDNLEIILVDDGSPDRSPAKCDEWAKRDNRIKVIHKKNGGLGLARNSALEIATGDYVAFVDSDDYIEREMYETLMESAIRHDADMVSCGFNKQTADGDFIKFIEFEHTTVIDGDGLMPLVRRFMLSYWHKSLNVGVWHGVFRRTLTPLFVSEREFTPEDLIFTVNIGLRIRRYVYVNRSFYNYMYNAGGLCRTYKPDDFIKMVAGAGLLKEIFAEKGLEGEAERYIFTRSIFFHRYFIMADKGLSMKEKFREIKRLVSLPAYRAMLCSGHFREWKGKKLKYISIAYRLQRGLRLRLYFLYLLFDKCFIAGK